MACGCANKSKQKFKVMYPSGTLSEVFNTYNEAKMEARKTGGKVRVVNGAS